MADLNEQERQKLRDDLLNLNFNQANGRLKRMDRSGRLVYYRSAQQVGRWLTRYELKALGTRVTLVEEHYDTPDRRNEARTRAQFDLLDVIVEPTPDNRN